MGPEGAFWPAPNAQGPWKTVDSLLSIPVTAPGPRRVGEPIGCAMKGHEATDTGLAYAPVSQAHGHHHTVQCFALLRCSCTTAQTSSVPLQVAFDGALALAI